MLFWDTKKFWIRKAIFTINISLNHCVHEYFNKTSIAISEIIIFVFQYIKFMLIHTWYFVQGYYNIQTATKVDATEISCIYLIINFTKKKKTNNINKYNKKTCITTIIKKTQQKTQKKKWQKHTKKTQPKSKKKKNSNQRRVPLPLI